MYMSESKNNAHQLKCHPKTYVKFDVSFFLDSQRHRKEPKDLRTELWDLKQAINLFASFSTKYLEMALCHLLLVGHNT